MVLAEKIVEKVIVKEIIKSHREKMPERRKGYTQKAIVAGTRFICARVNMRTAIWVKSSSTCTKRVQVSGR